MGAEETRRRILEVAIEVIDAGGEEAVRVVDVAHRAGVSQGMVTYHFATRHNLIVEAQRERYAVAMLSDAEAAVAALDAAHDLDTVLALGRRLTALLFQPERIARRRARLNALGFAAGDSATWSAMRESTTDAISRLTVFFEALAARGILRPDLDPRAAASMVAAYSFGLVMSDLDDEAPPAERMEAVIERFQRSLMVDDRHATP